MVSVGSVEVSVKLGLSRLKQEALAASQLLNQELKDRQINVGINGRLDRINQLAREFAEATSQASQYTQALDAVSRQIGQAGAQINQFTNQINASGVAFDSARAKVSTLSDDADEFATQMQSLAAELDYQANSTDLLNASYDVLSSGFSDASDVADILKASVNGALGGFSDVGTVADATTTILNAYGKSADEAAKVVDILAQTQDKGKITINQYAGQIGEVASTAALAGLSLEELSAAVATATAKGQQSSAAISGVRQLLVNIIKPTDEAQKYLEKFGITNASATLRTEGLVGVLGRLKEAGATTDDLAKIFSDVTGLATVATIAGENLDDFRANLDAMASSAGKAEASASKVADSFQGQVTKAFNQSNEALVALGTGVQKATLPLLQGLTFLVENFNKLPAPVKETAGVLVALTGGALTLTGALAGIAATLPVINAGFKVLTGVAFSAAAATEAEAAASAKVAAADTAEAAASAAAATANAAEAAAATATTAANNAEATASAQSAIADSAEAAASATNTLANATEAAATASAGATGAFSGTVGALKSLAPTIAANIAKLGLLAAAAYSVTLAFSRFSDGGSEFKESAGNIQKALLDIRTEAEQTKTAIDNLLPEEPPPTDWLDAIVFKLNEVDGFINEKLGLPEDFLALPTNADKQLTDLKNGVTQFQSAIDQLTSKSATFNGTQEDAVKIQEAYATALQEAKTRLEGLDPAKIGTKAYEELKTQLENTIKVLENEKSVFETRTGITDDATAATETLTEAIEAQSTALEDITSRFGGQTAAAEQAYTDQQIAIANAIAAGNKTEETGRQENLKAESDYLNQRLKINREKAAELKEALAAATDPEQQKAIQQELVTTESEIQADRLAIAEAGAQARVEADRTAAEAAKEAEKKAAEEQKRVREDAIADFERANARASQAVENSQNARVAAVREAQLQGVIGEEEAAARIAQIQQDSIAQTIAAKEDEIARVRELRANGTISAEEAGDREAALIQELGALNLQRIEGELAAQEQLRQARIQAIEDEFQARKSKLEGAGGGLDLQRDSLNQQQELLGAQVGLQEALGQLEAERLNTRLAAAEAAGDEQAVERIKAEQLRLQSEQIDRQYEAQKAQLKISQQIRGIELERERINARIAVLEAQAAIAKAQAEGASADEIAALQQVLGLREQQVGAVNDAIAQQEELNRIQDQTLDAQYAINRERQRQTEIQADAARRQEAANASDSQTQGNGSNSGRAETRQDRGIQYTTYSTRSSRSQPSYDPATQYIGNDGRVRNRRINASGSSALSLSAIPTDSPIRSLGLSPSATADRSMGDGAGAIVARLDKLEASILRLANSPRNLSVSTPDPIANVGSILNQISQCQARGAKI